MKDQNLNVDLFVLRRSHGKLINEKAVLNEQIVKLFEALNGLDSCWQKEAEINFANTNVELFAKLNSLLNNMGNLSECMDYALKIYSECENAAASSVMATNF